MSASTDASVELHIGIRFIGLEPHEAADLLERRWDLEDAIEREGIGEVVDAGIGLEGLDVFVAVEDPIAAVERIGAVLVELGLAALATIREVEPEAPRARPPWSPGDCLALLLGDGSYGAAIVLGEQSDVVLVGVLRYRAHALPDAAVFEQRRWLVLDHHAWENEQELCWCDTEASADLAALATKVATTPLRPDDPRDAESFRDLSSLALQIRMQSDWDAERKRPW